MKKWIHEKTGVRRDADISEKTAKGHGFIPYEEPELKPVPSGIKEVLSVDKNTLDTPKTEDQPVKTEAPKEVKPTPKKPRGRQRKKVD